LQADRKARATTRTSLCMATVGGCRDESRPFGCDPTGTQDGTARLYDGHSSVEAAWRAGKDGVTSHDAVSVATTTDNDDDSPRRLMGL
jgi:hypothetical protein